MDDVMNYEKDHNRAQAGENLEDRGVFYQTIMGLNADMSGPRAAPTILEEQHKEEAATRAASAAQGALDMGALLSINLQPAARDDGFAAPPMEPKGVAGEEEGGEEGGGEEEEGDEDDDSYVSSEDDGLTPEERAQKNKEDKKVLLCCCFSFSNSIHPSPACVLPASDCASSPLPYAAPSSQAHKQAVKEANREKRKTKMPKHVKKKKEKAGKKKK
jgi:RIO kinase 1